MVGDDGISPFYQYISPTDGSRHQVWVDDPSALNKKVSAIAKIPGLRGTGMWTANAFHRSDQALSAKAGADGAMSAGKHTAFIFAADNARERDDWQRAIHENILCTRFNKLAGAAG